MGEQRPAQLFSPEFWADPFPYFARLRAEEPVHRAILPPRTPIWFVTRHEDVLALLKDDRFAKDGVDPTVTTRAATWRPSQRLFTFRRSDAHLKLGQTPQTNTVGHGTLYRRRFL
jgi:cytochrome P450